MRALAGAVAALLISSALAASAPAHDEVGRGSFTEGGSCQDRRSTDYIEYYIQD